MNIAAVVQDCRDSAAVARKTADGLEEFPLRESEISTSPSPNQAPTEPTESQSLNVKPWEAAGVSRATWFRQRHAERRSDPYIPYLLTIWCAIQRGDQLTAERGFVNMLQAKLPTTADRRTVDAALRAAIKQARKARGAESPKRHLTAPTHARRCGRIANTSQRQDTHHDRSIRSNRATPR